MLLLRYINDMSLLNTNVNVRDYINDHHFYNSDDMEIFIVDQLFNRDPTLSKHRKLTRIMLFYMYWNCDIGEVEDAASQ